MTYRESLQRNIWSFSWLLGNLPPDSDESKALQDAQREWNINQSISDAACDTHLHHLKSLITTRYMRKEN